MLLDAVATSDLEFERWRLRGDRHKAPYRPIYAGAVRGDGLRARTMKLYLICVLTVVVTVVSACGNSGEPGRPEQRETPVATGPVLPAFLDEGPIALKIDGIPVPRATIDRYLAIWKIRRPRASDKTLLREAIEEGIVPIAAMYAEYSEADIAELSARAWTAHARLERGEQWDVVIAEMSDDPNKENYKGSIGMRRRLAVPGLALVSAEIEQRAFEMKLEQYSEPFCTDKGVEIVRAINEVRLPNQGEAEVQREIFSLLFAWGAEYREHLAAWGLGKPEEEVEAFKGKLKRLQEQMKRRIRRARVEVLDETYRSLVYPFRLRKS